MRPRDSHAVVALVDGRSTRVGTARTERDGSISVVLEAGVVAGARLILRPVGADDRQLTFADAIALGDLMG